MSIKSASLEARELMRRWFAAGANGPPTDWVKAKAMYFEGASLTVIGTAIGVTRQAVNQYARRHEWKRSGELLAGFHGQPGAVPGPSRPPPPPQNEPEEIDAKLGRMVVNGLDAIEKRIERVTPAEVERLQIIRERVRKQRIEELNSKAGASGISLEAMGEKHQALRKHVRDHVDDSVSGVLHEPTLTTSEVDGADPSTSDPSFWDTGAKARERAPRAKAAGLPRAEPSSAEGGEQIDPLVELDDLPEVASPGALGEMLAGIEGAT